jgi:hypothetical protein
MIRLRRDIIDWKVEAKDKEFYISVKLQGVYLNFPIGPIALRPDRVRLVLELESPTDA